MKTNQNTIPLWNGVSFQGKRLEILLANWQANFTGDSILCSFVSFILFFSICTEESLLLNNTAVWETLFFFLHVLSVFCARL